MEIIKVCIIGCGPAGIGSAKKLSLLLKNIDITIIESGESLENRIKNNDIKNIVNGFGGAGAFSDRKISVPPAGSNIIKYCNTNVLYESYKEELEYIRDNVNESNDKISQLIDVVDNFFAKNIHNNSDFDYDILKEYSTVCLSSFDEAYNWLNSYNKYFESNNIKILYNTQVVKIEKINKKYRVYTNSKQNEYNEYNDYDYINICTGRFGSLQNIIVNKTNLMRLEIGTRVIIDEKTKLYSSLINCQKLNKLCVDPKYIIKKNYNIMGYNTEIEFRTFCVCMNGYTVKSCDINTGLYTYSGSSSFNEYKLRKDKDFVEAGTNIGIMMRIKTSELLYTYFNEFLEDVKKKCSKNHNTEIIIDIKNPSLSNQKISDFFPKEFVYPLIDGITSLISTINTTKLDENIKIRLPCIEGVCNYPKINLYTFESIDNENIYYGGDIVGHTRGLLQGFVMGNIVAKNIYIKTLGLETYNIWANIKNLNFVKPDNLNIFYIDNEIKNFKKNNETYIFYEYVNSNSNSKNKNENENKYFIEKNINNNENNEKNKYYYKLILKLKQYSKNFNDFNDFNVKKSYMEILTKMFIGSESIEDRILSEIVYINILNTNKIELYFNSDDYELIKEFIIFEKLIKIFSSINSQLKKFMIEIECESIISNNTRHIGTVINRNSINVIKSIINSSSYMFFVSSDMNKIYEINEYIRDKFLNMYIFRINNINNDLTEFPVFTEKSNIINLLTISNKINFSDIMNSIGIENIVKCYEGQSCKFESIIVCNYNNKINVFNSYINGKIVKPRGINGFGWDSIFKPDLSDKTLGMMTTNEKNNISPRIKNINEFLLFYIKI